MRSKRPTHDPQTPAALTEMPATMIFESNSRLMVSHSPAGWGTGSHRPVCQNVDGSAGDIEMPSLMQPLWTFLCLLSCHRCLQMADWQTVLLGDEHKVIKAQTLAVCI